ncbi:MAG: DUF2797 domain-containing protein [Candidatus Thorarchaeota archaeon]
MDGRGHVALEILLGAFDMQVMNVLWKPTSGGSYESGLRVWSDETDSPFFLSLPSGHEVAWTIHGPKRCIGSIDVSGVPVRCPENSLVRRGMRRCGPCSAMDEMDPCIRCDGRNCNASDSRKDKCLSTRYAVYLAVFNDNTLKIGVSSKSRVVTRWVEQGADFGGIIGIVKGGQKARQIERRLGTSPDIKKQVRAERKAKHLLTSIGLERAQDIAQGFLNTVKEIEIESEVSLQDLSNYYSIDSLNAEPQRWRSGRTSIEGLQMAGQVVGMKGSLLVTRIGAAFTVANLTDLIGYELDDTSEVKVVSQTGLLDFL